MTFQKISKRDQTVDLLKGLGILTVIAGHCDFPIFFWANPYSFHMPLFFFISGFFINFKRTTVSFISDKFIKLIIPYYKYWFAFSIITLALQYTKAPMFGTGGIDSIFNFKNFILAPLMNGHQFGLICPLWFVVSLFLVMVIISLSRPILLYFCQNEIRAICSFVALLIIIQIIAFITPTHRDWYFEFSVTSIRTIVGFLFASLGFIFWKFKDVFLSKPVVLFFSLLFVYFTYKYAPHYNLLCAEFGIGKRMYFYTLVNLSGIYFCFFIVHIIRDINIINKWLGYIGRKSFHIMALHLTGFFLLNLIIAKMKNFELSQLIDVYYRLPGTKSIYYFLFGLVFSLLLCFAYDRYLKHKTEKE